MPPVEPDYILLRTDDTGETRICGTLPLSRKEAIMKAHEIRASLPNLPQETVFHIQPVNPERIEA